MPTSSLQPTSHVVNLVNSLKPTSILDVGCGFGKYGLLFREALEVSKGRYFKGDWVVRIDALEVFKSYITPVHKFVYDNLFIGDVVNFEFVDYDLIFFGDVLEHLDKEVALQVVDRASRGHNVLIVTPNGFYEQGAWFGNEHEVHKCGFSSSDFERFNGSVLKFGIMMVVFIKCRA